MTHLVPMYNILNEKLSLGFRLSKGHVLTVIKYLHRTIRESTTHFISTVESAYFPTLKAVN